MNNQQQSSQGKVEYNDREELITSVPIDGFELGQTFVMKGNNCMVKEPCPLCGVWDRADTPYWIFIAVREGGEDPICTLCAQKHVPLMLKAAQALNQVAWDEEQYVKVEIEKSEEISGEINSLAELFKLRRQITPESLVRIAALSVEHLQATWGLLGCLNVEETPF